MRPSSSGWHPGKASTKGTSIGIAISLKKVTCNAVARSSLASRERERETLHLFQPPRADQMPDPCWGWCHNIRLGIL